MYGVSISYLDQTLGKIESQARQVLNFAGIQFYYFVVPNFSRAQNFAKIVKTCKNCKI